MTISIVHVEDDQDIREIVSMALEFASDYELIQFNDGDHCLAEIGDHVPDLFLLDVMMPGMDGMRLLANLRQQQQHTSVPAIFMTARVQSSEIQPLLDAGAIGVIPKPFDPLTLAPEITKLLNSEKV